MAEGMSNSSPTGNKMDLAGRTVDVGVVSQALINELADRVALRVASQIAEYVGQSAAADVVDEPRMAEIAGVSPQTIARRRKGGEIPHVRAGRRVLYRPADVLAALSTDETQIFQG